MQKRISQKDFNSIVNPSILVLSYDIQENIPKKGCRIYRKCDNTLFVDTVFSKEQTAKTFLRKVLGKKIREQIIQTLRVKSWWDIYYDTRRLLLQYNNPTLWKTIYDEFEFRKI